ncbi:hypothetical protein IQ07DRAFT_14416 [Pyrenochaeta sp. DS3sAY3a]|nr:hypothetical protein IQ07DRAFT_14416 [Pyrenochaeta sp. DS3sAY3a]
MDIRTSQFFALSFLHFAFILAFSYSFERSGHGVRRRMSFLSSLLWESDASMALGRVLLENCAVQSSSFVCYSVSSMLLLLARFARDAGPVWSRSAVATHVMRCG